MFHSTFKETLVAFINVQDTETSIYVLFSRPLHVSWKSKSAECGTASLGSQSRKVQEASSMVSYGTTFLSEQQTLPLSLTHRNTLTLPLYGIPAAFLCNLFSVFYITCQLSISQLDLCVLDPASDPVCFFSQKISQFCCLNPHSRCLCLLASQQYM